MMMAAAISDIRQSTLLLYQVLSYVGSNLTNFLLRRTKQLSRGLVRPVVVQPKSKTLQYQFSYWTLAIERIKK